MSDEKRPFALHPDDIAELQESMLCALLLQLRLPGSAEPLDLLHRLGLGNRDVFHLLDQNLSPSISPAHLPAPLRIVPTSDLANVITRPGSESTFVIEFLPSREELGGVKLTLRICSYGAQPALFHHNLGTLEVMFFRAGERWLVRGTPTTHIFGSRS
jgi:hypothetical protein